MRLLPRNIYEILPFPMYEIFKMFVPIVLDVTTTVEGKSLGVLGMPESGKTQLYKTLKNEKYTQEEATSIDEYPQFDFVIKGRKFKVKSGKDIGGGEMYMQSYYEKFIKEKDVIVFVFDIKRYLEDLTYARKVRSRLEFIWRKLMEKAGIMDYILDIFEIKRRYILFASHGDQLTTEQKKNVKSELFNSVQGKEYAEMFHNNMYITDLRDRKNCLNYSIKQNCLDEYDSLDSK